MSHYTLRLHLLRDTTFGRGDGVAGVLDIEIDQDQYGLPFLRGRALKGLLVYECAEIIFALQQQGQDAPWRDSARFLFGRPGALDRQTGQAQLHIGNACLPDDLRQAIRYQFELDSQNAGELRTEVLDALTTIRRQTAVAENGVAKEHSLRAVRLIRRQTQFEAPLIFTTSIKDNDRAKGLLAACVKSFRRAGTGRNRGPGLLQANLYEQGVDVTDSWFQLFKQEVKN